MDYILLFTAVLWAVFYLNQTKFQGITLKQFEFLIIL